MTFLDYVLSGDIKFYRLWVFKGLFKVVGVIKEGRGEE